MTRLQPFWHQRSLAVHVSIIDSLEMLSSWHGDCPPQGTTGDYALDMLLADAFRAMLYRHELKDRLAWIEREVQRPRRRQLDDLYHAELITWWLDLFGATKLPPIDERIAQRRLTCVS